MMIFMGAASFFNQYNGNKYEVLIRILHSFLNRSINIIMDSCYNGHAITSQFQSNGTHTSSGMQIIDLVSFQFHILIYVTK